MTPDVHQFFTLFAQISKKIHANNDTRDILTCIVENITRILSAKGSIFWILNTKKQCIETKIFHGFDYRSLMHTDYPTLMTLFENQKKDCVVISNAREDDRIPDLERLGKRKVNSVTGLFFDIAGPYTGLLAVYFTGNRTLAGIPVAFLMHAGAALFIWVFLKALGGNAAFLTAYFFIGVAAVSLWPVAPFLAMFQSQFSPGFAIVSLCVIMGAYGLAVTARMIQDAFELSLIRMGIALSATVIYIGCFLYLWM